MLCKAKTGNGPVGFYLGFGRGSCDFGQSSQLGQESYQGRNGLRCLSPRALRRTTKGGALSLVPGDSAVVPDFNPRTEDRMMQMGTP